MISGVSSASLYPMVTEEAINTLAELGVKDIEIFINDMSELKGGIREDILGTVKRFDMNVISVHPFSSPMESVYLFSDYERRRTALLDMYREYFEFMNCAGAKLFVLHGAILSSHCSDENYFRQYERLLDVADEYGVTVVQENICYCKSCSIEFLSELRKNCGNRVKYVLDLKQAYRSKLSPFEIIETLGSDIIHVHISDSTEQEACLPIGKGNFDFRALIEALREKSFDGALMLELYRNNYEDYSELYDGMIKIKKCCNISCNPIGKMLY